MRQKEDRFQSAVNTVIKNEGGYSNDPDDRGGVTKYGISDLFCRQHGINITIKDLTLPEAKQLYRHYFWDKYNFDGITDLTLATKAFDAAVNIGPGTAIKLLQSICFDEPNDKRVDGILGPVTLKAVNARYVAYMLSHYKLLLHDYYKNLVVKNPKNAKFLDGWLTRAFR